MNCLHAVTKSLRTLLFDRFFVKAILENVRFETCCGKLSLLPGTFTRDVEQTDFLKCGGCFSACNFPHKRLNIPLTCLCRVWV